MTSVIVSINSHSSCVPYNNRQKQWNYIKFLLKEHMDFRTSRLPPGTYANMVAAAAAALNKSRASSARNRDKNKDGDKKPVAMEEPLILPGMQDGE